MNRLIIVLSIILLSLFCYACSSSRNVKSMPPFRISKITLARGINQAGPYAFPVEPSDTFNTQDSEIVSYIEFANLVGDHELRWEWHDPSNNLYSVSKNHLLSASEGKYISKGTAWHIISLEEIKAQKHTGKWNVNIFLDNELFTSRTFKLEGARPKAGLPERKGYAVVIGISKYMHAGDNFTNLPFADDDAKAMRNMLSKLGWEDDHIKYLADEKATYRNVTIALESWLTKAKENDLILLYWSGHGFPDPENPEKVYFACYDTDPNIPATGYRMDRVIRSLSERNTKNVVVFADTCHAGKLITRGKRGLSLVPYIENLKYNKQVPKGWIYMVGADTDRQAIEHSSWSNGAFTHCLIKALSGQADGYESIGQKDNIVTLGELRAYMESVMPNETQRVLGVAKHPVITTSSGDPEIWKLNLQLK